MTIGKSRKTLAVFLAGALALGGCGGGGGGDDSSSSSSTTTTDGGSLTSKMTVKGSVYDALSSGAVVTAHVGGAIVGSGSSDAAGGYSIDITYPTADSSKQLVLKAQRDTAVLISVVGTVDAVAAVSTRAVTSEPLLDLDVTNVSTAIYAIVKQDSGVDPATLSATALADAREVIRASAAKQELVLQLAAAVKAVIDHGANVDYNTTDQVELADTLALAEHMATVAAPNIILTTLASEVGLTAADLTEAVASDPNVASQLLLPPVTTADLAGKRFAIGSDTLFVFNADNTFTGYDYEMLVNAAETGTWSFDEASQTLTVTLASATTPLTMVLNGGSIDSAVPVTVTNGGVTEQLTLYRALAVGSGLDLELAAIPQLTFDFANERFAYQSGICDGTTPSFFANASGWQELACQVINEAIVQGAAPLATSPAYGDYSVVVPRVSSDGRFNFAHWAANPVNPDEIITTYVSALEPVDKPLPTGGSVRVDTGTGVVSLAIATAGGCNGATADACVQTYEIKPEGQTEVMNLHNVWRTRDASAGAAGKYFILSDADTNVTDGNSAVVFRLAGSTETVRKEGVLTAVMVDDIAAGAFSATVNTRVKTRTVYALTDFTTAEVSGKTFTFTDEDGSPASVIFNADGTYVSGTETGTWQVRTDDIYPYTALWMETTGSEQVLFKVAANTIAGETRVANLYFDAGVFQDVAVFTVKAQ